MRIRRTSWLPGLLATAALPLFVATAAQAQNTSPTVASDAATTGSPAANAVYNLELGDQLLYSTKGSVAMTGAGQTGQREAMDIMTSLTVLQKSSDSYTMYASLTANSKTTGGKTEATPGPRFTFELPVSGSDGLEEFEKAGLSGAAFPTFSVETIFAAPPDEGQSTVTVALPITNSVADGKAVTTRQGGNLKTVATVTRGTTPVLTRTTIFSTQKGLTQSIDTTVNLALTAQNMPIKFTIEDHTELVGVEKLDSGKIANLKQDIESAIPIATKLRTLSMSSPDVMKRVLDDVNAYLAAHPNGEFAFLFKTLKNELGEVVQRTANWDKIKKGQPAPDFTATTIDGKTVTLSDLKGQVVLLDFWATWCGPCMMELPNVKKMYDKYKDQGFEIIGISADETVEDLKQVVQQENLQWPQIFDGGDKPDSIQKQYGVMKYPTTILVDQEGNIHAIDLRGEALEAAVQELLGAAGATNAGEAQTTQPTAEPTS